MSGQRAVADALVGNPGKGRLQSCQQLGAELIVNLVTCIISVDIAADILVEQDRIGHLISILTEAADGDIQIETDVLVYYAERNRARGPVFISDDVLCIEIVNTLVFGSNAAVSDAGRKFLEALFDSLTEAAGEDTGLRRSIISVGTGLSTDIHNSSLVDDDHALTFIDNDRGTIGDHILTAAPVEDTRLACVMLALADKHIRRHFRAVKIFFPLISENRTKRSACC